MFIAGTVIGFLAGRLSAARVPTPARSSPEPEPSSEASGSSALGESQPDHADTVGEEAAPVEDVVSSTSDTEDETASPTVDGTPDGLLTGAEREELLWLRTRVEQQRSHIGTLESLLDLTRSNHEEPTESPPGTD